MGVLLDGSLVNGNSLHHPKRKACHLDDEGGEIPWEKRVICSLGISRRDALCQWQLFVKNWILVICWIWNIEYRTLSCPPTARNTDFRSRKKGESACELNFIIHYFTPWADRLLIDIRYSVLLSSYYVPRWPLGLFSGGVGSRDDNKVLWLTFCRSKVLYKSVVRTQKVVCKSVNAPK